MKIVYFVMVWNIQVKISALGWGGGRGLKYLAHLDSLVEHICCFMFHSGWAAALWDGSNVTKQKCFMHAMLACKHAHTHTHTRMQAQILSCMIDGLTFHFDISIVLCFWGDSLHSSRILIWMSDCSFTQCMLNIHSSAVWLLRGWCHLKLLPPQRTFCVNHTAMHQFTLLLKTIYIGCMCVYL